MRRRPALQSLATDVSMTFNLLGQMLVAALGAFAGVGVMGTADHFTHNRSLTPLPVCTGCGRRGAAFAYVPILGALLRQGRCVLCAHRNAWLLTAAVQAVCGWLAFALFGEYGFSDLFGIGAIEAWVLVTVAVIDLQHRLIPTLLVYPTILFALAVSPAWPKLGLESSFIAGVLAFAIFFALAFLARVLFGDGALGDGDVTLAALIGAITGYPLMVLSLALGALAGGVGAILLLVLRRSPMGSTIPYGPYLVIGVLYVLLTGNSQHPFYFPSL